MIATAPSEYPQRQARLGSVAKFRLCKMDHTDFGAAAGVDALREQPVSLLIAQQIAIAFYFLNDWSVRYDPINTRHYSKGALPAARRDRRAHKHDALSVTENLLFIGGDCVDASPVVMKVDDTTDRRTSGQQETQDHRTPNHATSRSIVVNNALERFGESLNRGVP